MRKLMLVAFTLILSVVAVNVSAQSFLKQLSNNVKKEIVNQVAGEVKKQVNKGVEKLTGEQQSQEQQSQAQTQQEQSQAQPVQAQEAPSQEASSTIQVNDIQTIATMIEYGALSGKLNGHEWVDLGLPSGTRWATCNVDATSPEQPGKLYAWGETATKTSYTAETCKLYNKDVADFSGDKTYDLAALKWGDGWRMPTKKEFDELLHFCTWKYVQKGGRWGAEITSMKNNNSIFLPATGSKEGTSHQEANGCGMYWTSTPYADKGSEGIHEYHFGAALGEMGVAECFYGFAIRPITDYDVNTEIPSSGEINGHKWVDLGLPSGLKWATCNIGSKAVDQDGDHYAWGEVIPYTDNESKKNKLSGKESGDIAGQEAYDAARALWGGTWRLPTEADFKELVENCTFEWTSIGRRSGLKVTSKANGNYIFLPASGVFKQSSDSYGFSKNQNKYASYWTSTPERSSYHYGAYALNCSSTNCIILSSDRFCGYSIRPVSE
ncbi:MAG: hypothetical protein II299_06005 [Alistipes sp.]|nr:hypothetical protein [Alistipes sp.]